MRLAGARVTNFRSVEDSGEFTLERATCLVGKNEAGKTAILSALTGLNPYDDVVTFDKERDYPRRFLADYDTRHPDEQAVVVSTTWELDAGQIEAISEQFGPYALTSPVVTIARSYGDESPRVTVALDEAAAVEHFVADERPNAAETAALARGTTASGLRAAVKVIDTPTEKQTRIIARLDALPGKSILGAVGKIISGGLPKFMYFSHYDRMEGQLQLSTFDQRRSGQLPPPIKPGEKVFINFLEYAGTSLNEINETTTYEGLNARCEAASNRITQQLLEYWTQNPYLDVDVRVTKGEPNDPPPFNNGVVARARVRNNIHKVSVPFSERSAGFIWFFSFLVKFAQVRKEASNLLLLLDEPGLTLHGKAQADLLRYFEDKLTPHHQIVFSTHSPFMVPADKLDTVRIVEDRITIDRSGRPQSEGTKVSADVLVVDADTLFPLQGALGYDITQSLFVGKHTLLVEGPSDILYLNALSAELGRRGRTTLDSRWTICPAGGIDKIQSFIGLFSGQNLHVAALTDFAKGDRKKHENLQRSCLMQGDRLKTFATALELEEADVEDIFSPETYAALINAAFDLRVEEQANTDSLVAADDRTTRLVKKGEAFFRTLSPETAKFDHYTPSYWLLSNPAFLSGNGAGIGITLDRAEKVIIAANRMLSVT